MTPKKPVGIAQCFLLAFGGDADPAPMAFCNFMEEVTLPILVDLFALIVRRVGPTITAADEPHACCSDQQNQVVQEVAHITKLHARRHEMPETFRSALPKSLYWLGTSLLLHHTISYLWTSALTRAEVACIPAEIQDGAFAAALRFTHRRYLAGKAVLAISVKI